MPPVIPHTTPPAWPDDIPASRMASLIRRAGDSADGCRVAILGLPDDLGVRLNSGRPGAKAGPAAFRAALARYGVAEPDAWRWPGILDAGDVAPAPGDTEEALHQTHRHITAAAAAIRNLGLIPVGIGGGHDLTFPFVRGAAGGPLGGLYFDAHLDVRPTVGSGMPFRRLIEECGVGPLQVRGLNPLVNSGEHTQWFKAHGGSIAGMDAPPPPPLPPPPPGNLFVSMDLDVLDAAHAPGVSAPNPCGCSPHDLARWARWAGREPRVRCFDLMELCPPMDVDGRTARIAAHLFLCFLRGVAEREGGEGGEGAERGVGGRP